MTRRYIVECSIHLVTKLFIKRPRLKIEGLEVCIKAAHLLRLDLGHFEQPLAESPAPESILQPDITDVQPVPGYIGDQPADETAGAVPDKKSQLAEIFFQTCPVF